MLALEEMTPEQRAVLRACEDRFDGVVLEEGPPPEPPPVYVCVTVGDATDSLVIHPDGTIRTVQDGWVPTALYGRVPREPRGYDTGVPKHGKQYMPQA
jgi:hypothetical protein